jgi:hypothetical protein
MHQLKKTFIGMSKICSEVILLQGIVGSFQVTFDKISIKTFTLNNVLLRFFDEGDIGR